MKKMNGMNDMNEVISVHSSWSLENDEIISHHSSHILKTDELIFPVKVSALMSDEFRSIYSRLAFQHAQILQFPLVSAWCLAEPTELRPIPRSSHHDRQSCKRWPREVGDGSTPRQVMDRWFYDVRSGIFSQIRKQNAWSYIIKPTVSYLTKIRTITTCWPARLIKIDQFRSRAICQQ